MESRLPMRRFLFSVLLTTLFVLSASAQDAPAKTGPSSAVPVTLGHSVVALTGPWKFHIGDNPQWADPGFNDSKWENVDLHVKQGSIDPMMGFAGFVPGWTAKGHPGYSGYAWYRIRVRITGADEPLALLGPLNFDDAYQLFVNGRLIGSFGHFNRPVPAIYTDRAVRFALPADTVAANHDGTAVLAFRFYMAPRTLQQIMAGGLHAPPVIGFSDAVTAAYHVAWEDLYRGIALLIPWGMTEVAFALFVLMLYLFDRHERDLFWPLAASLSALGWMVLTFAEVVGLLTALTASVAISVLGPIWWGLWLLAFWVYFGLHDKKWLRNAIVILTVWKIAASILFNVLLLRGDASRQMFAAHAFNLVAADTVTFALIVAIGWLGWQRSRREHWLLFLALAFTALPSLSFVFHLLHVPTRWFPYHIRLDLGLVCELVILLCFPLVLLRRFRNSQRRQQAMEEDVAQAQQVQQVLIPEELPHVPGLTIESEYRSAREVGGDFFQIIPRLTDGSVLIVAGDVTGKGLQAGMLVALIVGIIRNETAHTFDPLTILNALNRTLCGRGHAHATCLAMRIEADGAATLANAGHLPPYLNGKELPMEGALPLGMIENAEFSAMRFQLQENDRLILMSDGVVEAQDAHGHLFGFDRIQEMMKKPVTAAEVATAAQTFGQQDDISVLRIVRVANDATKESMEPALALV
jgi:hypothetical protein